MVLSADTGTRLVLASRLYRRVELKGVLPVSICVDKLNPNYMYTMGKIRRLGMRENTV